MSCIDINVDLDNDTIRELIEIYIRDNMSNASYSLFKEDTNGFMIAAANAIRNEAIVDAIIIGMKNDKVSET